MYEAFYGFKVDPFRLSPDHRFSFLHPSYKKAQAYMRYSLGRAEGFVMVTGCPGTGKTTLINDLLSGIDQHTVSVARLATTQLQGEHFLRAVAYAFGLAAEGIDQATLLRDIERFLVSLHQGGRRALLVVDEAQDLRPSALTELRLLANMQQGSTLLMQAFLIGQEHLASLVRAPEMEQFRQRIIAACNLRPLDLAETRAYIEHRVRCAGWQGDPAIEGEVFRHIHRFSQGIPRQINLVCSRLLLHGCVEERHRLTVDDAISVIDELHEERLSPPGVAGFERRAPAPPSERDASAWSGAPRGRESGDAPAPRPRPGAPGVGARSVTPAARPARRPPALTPVAYLTNGISCVAATVAVPAEEVADAPEAPVSDIEPGVDVAPLAMDASGAAADSSALDARAPVPVAFVAEPSGVEQPAGVADELSMGTRAELPAGPEVGPSVGSTAELPVGPEVGPSVGSEAELRVGPEVGPSVGSTAELPVGPEVGPSVGLQLGLPVGPGDEPPVAPSEVPELPVLPEVNRVAPDPQGIHLLADENRRAGRDERWPAPRGVPAGTAFGGAPSAAAASSEPADAVGRAKRRATHGAIRVALLAALMLLLAWYAHDAGYLEAYASAFTSWVDGAWSRRAAP